MSRISILKGWTTYWSPQASSSSKNTLLAAESLGSGVTSHVTVQKKVLNFRLPDYTYPFLGLPLENNCGETTFAIEQVAFWRRIPRTRPISCDCPRHYAGARATDSWRSASYSINNPTRRLLEKHKLLWNEERRSWTGSFIEKRKSWPYQLLRL